MNGRDPQPRRHWPTLLCAFLAMFLGTSFWMMFETMEGTLSDAFRLTPVEKGLMFAAPVLAGAFLQLVFGVFADRIGARRAALWALGLTMVPLVLGWIGATGVPLLVLVGMLLGIGGAIGSAALPLASRWSSPENQGFVLGIVGMGSAGASVGALVGPWLVRLVGWRDLFGLATIPVAVVFLLLLFVARDEPRRPAPRTLYRALAALDLGTASWFCGMYALTFGGFVGLTLYIPVFFRDQYGIDPIRGGVFAAVCAVIGSLFRPVGGVLSDRLGGLLILFLCLVGVGVLGLRMSYVPHLESAILSLFFTLALLAMGTGAVFQMVPQWFQDQFGLVTGLLGGAGSLCGLLIPIGLVNSRVWTGRSGPGFFVLGMAAFTGAGLLIQASRTWHAHRNVAEKEPIPARAASSNELAPAPKTLETVLR